jgi:predicted Zn-dependent protease
MPFAGYRFVLVESADANAFAVPGGIVCVCTGLLDFLKNEDELAAVLGHEIAHVEMRHGLKSLDQNAMLTICSDALGLAVAKDRDLSSPKVKEAIKLVVDEMFNRIRNGYSADLEGQADWRAIQFLARLGYDVKSLHAVLERFKEKFGTYGGAKYPERRSQDVDTYRRQFGLGENVAEGQRVREMRYKMTLGF